MPDRGPVKGPTFRPKGGVGCHRVAEAYRLAVQEDWASGRMTEVDPTARGSARVHFLGRVRCLDRMLISFDIGLVGPGVGPCLRLPAWLYYAPAEDGTPAVEGCRWGVATDGVKTPWEAIWSLFTASQPDEFGEAILVPASQWT